MNNIKKINKYILYLTSFCFVFLFLFSFNFGSLVGGDQGVFVGCYGALEGNGGKVQGSQQNVGGGNQAKENEITIESDFGMKIFLYPLSWLLQLIGFFIVWAVGIVEWTLTPEFMSIFNEPAILEGWKYVRDFLNIAFIFFLLFSAFATIFQVSKYHIKSTWVMIVVMALLVNFSWPITRAMIDMSNITMEYIIGSSSVTNGKNSLMANFGSNTEFVKLMIGKNFYEAEEGKSFAIVDEDGVGLALLTGIIMGFVFLITIGAIALILMIRVIILVILLIFASVGFVLMAFPSTRSQASNWWSSLTKQLVLGPVLLFLLLLAATILNGFNDNSSQFIESIKTHSNNSVGIETMMKYIISILLIWSGILAANKIGGEGTSMITNKASGMMRGTANKIKGNTWDRGARGVQRAGGYVGDQAKKEIGARTGITATKRRVASKLKSIEEKREAKREEKIAQSKFAKDPEAGRRKIENDKYVAQKKKNQESGITASEAEAKLAETDASGNLKIKSEGEIRAQMETAMAGANFGKNEGNYTKLASSVSQIQNEDVRNEMMSKLNKAYTDKGNAHAINLHEIETQKQAIANARGVSVAQLSGIELQQAKREANKKVYSGMNGKTFAKQKETIKKMDEGDESFTTAKRELNNKLNRVVFARNMQEADSETLERLERINGSNL